MTFLLRLGSSATRKWKAHATRAITATRNDRSINIINEERQKLRLNALYVHFSVRMTKFGIQWKTRALAAESVQFSLCCSSIHANLISRQKIHNFDSKRFATIDSRYRGSVLVLKVVRPYKLSHY